MPSLKREWTADDFDALPDDGNRYEIIDGELFVTPSPALAHHSPRGSGKTSRIWMVAIEVLSPTTARNDRVRKRKLDQRKRVDQYWIVDLDSRVIERYLPDDTRPEILSETLEWQPEGATTPFILDLDEYFSGVLDD